MNKSKSSLFLMELILAILIFAIAGAVCIQIFVKAHIISDNTKNLNQAVNICSSSAELFYGYNGDLEKIRSTLDPKNMGEVNSGILTMYYDANFDECIADNAEYKLEFLTARDKSLLKGDISLIKMADSSELYSIICSVYAPEKEVQ